MNFNIWSITNDWIWVIPFVLIGVVNLKAWIRFEAETVGDAKNGSSDLS